MAINPSRHIMSDVAPIVRVGPSRHRESIARMASIAEADSPIYPDNIISISTSYWRWHGWCLSPGTRFLCHPTPSCMERVARCVFADRDRPPSLRYRIADNPLVRCIYFLATRPISGPSHCDIPPISSIPCAQHIPRYKDVSRNPPL